MKLAEALAPELPPDRAGAVMDEYLDAFNSFYLENMRKKLGLLKREEPEDGMLITELLQTMHDTGETEAGAGSSSCGVLQLKPSAPAGADFTNTFRCLSGIPCPAEGEAEEEVVKTAADLLLEQCSSLEELKDANKPTMDPR